jgi:hypothetical protein
MSTEGIIVAAAQGTEWPLSLADFAGQLRTRWPEVRTWTDHSPAAGRDYVEFQIGGVGETRSGAYYERKQLDLGDGTPDDWADTISWFLHLLPPGTPSVCLLEAVPVVTPLPGTSSPAQVAAILNELNNS